jgi:hypothetical protein
MESDHPGLSRRELEQEARWLLRRVTSEVDGPTRKLVEDIVDIVLTLIDRNNAELARYFDYRASPHGGDDF